MINRSLHDQLQITVQDQTINYCNHYLYLGTWFTDDGKPKTYLSLHQPNWQSTINKFKIFCNSNTKMPFYFKKKVFKAAAASSLLYGSESWLTSALQKPVNNYNLLIKSLLDVRLNTSTNLCLAESGIPPTQFVVASKRKRFLMSKSVVLKCGHSGRMRPLGNFDAATKGNLDICYWKKNSNERDIDSER